jgi:hypothetical protein
MTAPLVTVVGLIYRSPEYLTFMRQGIRSPRNETPFETLIVACDPEPQIESDPRVYVVHHNDNPYAESTGRTYRAWNHGASLVKTPYVCFFNSDMYGYDHWLDALVEEIQKDPKVIPTSLLVENGRIPSAFPEYVHDFGTPHRGFDLDRFYSYAETIRASGDYSNGRLYMPVVFNTVDFLLRGGFPHWNGGDVHLIQTMKDQGYKHITCHGSIVYHTMRGETADD